MKDEGSRVRPVAFPRDQEAIMRRFRISIAGLLGVVLFIAVALAALLASTPAWDSGTLGLTSLSLLTAVLLAVHRTDRRRAFWLGFGLFGWAYLVASLIPPIGSRLPTTIGLAFIDSKIPGRQTSWVVPLLPYPGTYTNTYVASPVQGYVITPQANDLSTSIQNNVWLWDTTTVKLLAGPNGTTENFIRIGHSLLALVLAFVGGHLSRYVYGRGREDRSNLPIDSTASP
jgi:hypothetical protein